MKNLNFALLSLLAGTVLLTSCSTSSCNNPCNWRPGWKNSCNTNKCCDNKNYYYDNSGYNADYGDYADDGYADDGYAGGGYAEEVRAPQPAPAPVQREESTKFSPYPDTSVEDMPREQYIPEAPLDSRNTPYYDSSRPNNNQRRPEAQPVREQETPSIQKQDLDKIKSAHQRVLDRYKQRRQEDSATTNNDNEYFDQIVKKVVSKEKKN